MLRLQVGQSDNVLFKSLSGERKQNKNRRSKLSKFAGNLMFLVFVFIQCAIFQSIYTSGIITAVVRGGRSRPFESDEFAEVLGDKRYRLVSDSNYEASLFSCLCRRYLLLWRFAPPQCFLHFSGLKTLSEISKTQIGSKSTIRLQTIRLFTSIRICRMAFSTWSTRATRSRGCRRTPSSPTSCLDTAI